MNKAYYESPVGLLEIGEENDFIVSLKIINSNQKGKEVLSKQLDEAKKQLSEYFSGKRTVFDLPLKQKGTEFQQNVWAYIQTIPYGKTVSYKQEAQSIGNPKASRAVGSANGANSIPIIIPCHRIINANGKLGGFAYDIAIKEWLLNMEKENK